MKRNGKKQLVFVITWLDLGLDMINDPVIINMMYNKASIHFSRHEDDRRRIEEEEEEGVHTGSGASLYVACIIPLGERRSRETGRGGREEIGCYLSTGKKKKYTLARALCCALPRLTDSDMLPRNGGDDNACTSYQPRSDREGLTQREAEIKRGDPRRRST